MESKVKLSPAMQAAMWFFVARDNGNSSSSTWRAPGGELRRAFRVKMATEKALIGRGLLELGPFCMGQFTDAGRAWIAEQIEAARVEALTENIQWNIARSLEIIAMPREMDSKRTDVA